MPHKILKAFVKLQSHVSILIPVVSQGRACWRIIAVAGTYLVDNYAVIGTSLPQQSCVTGTCLVDNYAVAGTSLLHNRDR